MSKIEKLIKRFKTKPRDFTWQELEIMLARLGFAVVQGSGSRVKFYHKDKDCLVQVHKPHPGNVLKAYVVRLVLNLLESEGLI